MAYDFDPESKCYLPVSLDSSCLDDVRWWPDGGDVRETDGTLFVTFAGGDRYTYRYVPLNEALRLFSADSVGRYFNMNVRDAYECVPLGS